MAWDQEAGDAVLHGEGKSPHLGGDDRRAADHDLPGLPCRKTRDHGIGLIGFESGAIGQFEVSWAFRGGMDLRDEVSGTEGTVWIDHFLRTGLELFTAVGPRGYVSEKAEGETGWLFPVGEEPMETFYDGYVVNAIMDA